MYKNKNHYSLILIGIIVALITFSVYIPSLQNGFVTWDDNDYIYNNSQIRSIGIDFIKWSFTSPKVGHWLPLTWFSFAMDYAVWGLNPLGYHLTNILIHSLNTFLVFILVIRLFQVRYHESEGTYKKAFVTGIVTSLLFGIHPLHVESVAWATERKDVLSLFFFLTCILSYIKYCATQGVKKLLYYGICLILFMMGLMAKSMILTLPIVLLILDYFPLNHYRRVGSTKYLKQVLFEKIPFFALSLLSAWIAIWAASSQGATMSLGMLSFETRTVSIGRAYIFYLVKMVAPFNLAALYPYPGSIKIISFEYLGSFMLLLIIASLCFMSLKRWRFLFALWLYYMVTLIPVIGIIQAGSQAVADRYTYIPSLGPFLLAGLGVAIIFERSSETRCKALIIGLLILIFSMLAINTIRQSAIWKDSETFWTYNVKKIPQSPIAHYNLALSTGNPIKRIDEFKKTLYLNPVDNLALSKLASAYAGTGRYDLAIEYYNYLLKNKPGDKKILNDLGIVYYKKGDYKKAKEHFEELLRYDYNSPQVLSNLGSVYDALKEYEKAINILNRAITNFPNYLDAYYNIGIAYNNSGRYNEALVVYKRVLDIDKNSEKAHFALGETYFQIGNDSTAVDEFEKVISINSKNFDSYYNLFYIYAVRKDIHTSMDWLEKAVSEGFRDIESVKKDKVFAQITSDRRFIKIENMINSKKYGEGSR